MEVTAREGAEGGDADALELLGGVTDAELDALVDALLADEVRLVQLRGPRVTALHAASALQPPWFAAAPG